MNENCNYSYSAPQGWQCPICKKIYSPSTPSCTYCNSSYYTQQTTITTNVGSGTYSDTLMNNIDNLFSEGYPTQPMEAL